MTTVLVAAIAVVGAVIALPKILAAVKQSGAAQQSAAYQAAQDQLSQQQGNGLGSVLSGLMSALKGSKGGNSPLSFGTSQGSGGSNSASPLAAAMASTPYDDFTNTNPIAAEASGGLGDEYAGADGGDSYATTVQTGGLGDEYEGADDSGF
jgi:type II secretory pathway pseudopilin PulG